MAKPAPVKKAWRSLVWLLVIIVALVGMNAFGVFTNKGSWTPQLALDLEGGTQILLAPQLESGQTVSGEQLQQAVAIIRQRVNASGVSEAEITTQGNQNIVVSIPGEPDQATLDRIQASSQLQFRPVLSASSATTQSATDGTGEDSTTPTPTSEAAAPTATPTAPGDPAWVTEELTNKFNSFDCSSKEALESGAAASKEPLITCDPYGMEKYILGPVEINGGVITDATAQPEVSSSGVSTGGWAVQIVMNGEGAKQFAEVSKRLYGAQEPLNRFAFVLDGKVISAPTMQGQITDGRPSITGGFTQEGAKSLADQLKFGALPIGFEVQSQDNVSATLGSNQLQSGLLAGLIGLILVVLYSLLQYRLLGLVTVASLSIAAVITYLLITLMSWQEGYRLSLAGVAGLIVAIGITADSFIVYFERIRDELRDGRGIESAVSSGWKRALRTILASDGVNFLAAAVLFILAVGNVRGFAFTLGLTTIVDVVVVALFTHPVLVLLSRTKFYSEGHRFSGLDPRQLGAVYRGRAQFKAPVSTDGKVNRSSREAAKRQTIAERKAADLAASGDSSASASSDSRKES
ncbi:protein translocase subunit SecD [Klugiella xanthotipulae]|uniref:Protein translocase subunit SecD n=1 Tax=Klugiella xanthotipulae TaxID=244735 RepID=A0A543HS78_9MICO|nr:protein translocase subunit SecD [Klugiella xanthotipulae]TQM61201.1 preprotein translocase subunit SecD [Klugiella xanthotipulae]